MRQLSSFFLILTLLGAVFASASDLVVNGGTIQAFEKSTADLPPVWLKAGVDIEPESLEKGSQGDHVTVFVELPSGMDPASVDTSSLRLCLGTTPCASGVMIDGKGKVGDADDDDVKDLKITFDRGELLDLVKDVVVPSTVTFAVSGKASGILFVGADTVRLVGAASPTPTATPVPEPLDVAVAIAPDTLYKVLQPDAQGDSPAGTENLLFLAEAGGEAAAEENPAAVLVRIILPQGYSASQIDAGSIRLCRGIGPCAAGVVILPGSATVEAPDRLRVAFNTGTLLDLVSDIIKNSNVTFTVSGMMATDVGERPFVGDRSVKVRVSAEKKLPAQTGLLPGGPGAALVLGGPTATPTPAGIPMPLSGGPVFTATPAISVTPTIVPATFTAVPSATVTRTPTATPTRTPTRTPVLTSTQTATAVPSATPTVTPEGTATETPTATPTVTFTGTPAVTATGTAIPATSATPEESATPTSTATALPSVTATETATPTSTPTVAPSPTATATASPSPTPKPPTATPVPPTATLVPPTATATRTPSPTAVPPTATRIPTLAPTATKAPTAAGR